MSAVPLKKRARMSDNNIESPFSNASNSQLLPQQPPIQPQSWLDIWGPHLQGKTNYHAHFDCFSGVAGDMILASCIDAAGPGDVSDELLKLVDVCIRKGLPELDGEFELQKQRVWRGSGQIAATHITVHSRYEKFGTVTAAAPLPLKATVVGDESIGGTASRTATPFCLDDHVHQQQPSISPVPSSMEAHSHTHEHGHQHGHHQHDHEHHHDHHSHSHEEPTDPSLSNQNTAAAISAGNHNHTHSHSHSGSSSHIRGPLRNLPEITRMLNAAAEEWIPSWVRKKAIKSFTLLALAEAEVHGADNIDSVHFHEVGAVDSIVDMVGSLIALHALGVRSVTCSRLPIGEGMVTTDHGIMPVPAPAALRLMVGMPTTPGPPGYTGELVTPTGAALLRVLIAGGDDDDNDGISNASLVAVLTAAAAAPPGRPPRFTLRKLGIGAGTKDFVNHPNILRLMLGDCLTDKPNQS